MKLKTIPMLIAVTIGAVIAYFQYLIFPQVDVVGLVVVGTIQTIWLAMAYGIGYEGRGATVNINITSTFFFFVALVLNIIFMATDGKMEFMIAINLLLLLVNVGINYSVLKNSVK